MAGANLRAVAYNDFSIELPGDHWENVASANPNDRSNESTGHYDLCAI
jgi:hypothetical protein